MKNLDLKVATRADMLWEAFSSIFEDLIRISEDQFEEMSMNLTPIGTTKNFDDLDGAKFEFQINTKNLREMVRIAKQALSDLKSDKDFEEFVTDWEDEFQHNENIFNHYADFIEQLCVAQEKTIAVFMDELLKCSTSVNEILNLKGGKENEE